MTFRLRGADPLAPLTTAMLSAFQEQSTSKINDNNTLYLALCLSSFALQSSY